MTTRTTTTAALATLLVALGAAREAGAQEYCEPGSYDWYYGVCDEVYCNWPSLAECQSSAYLATGCGQQHVWTCSDIVGQAYLAERSGLATSTPMILPEEMSDGGALKTGARLGYDRARISMLWAADGTHVGTTLGHHLPAYSGAMALSPPWLDPYGWRKNSKWEANGALMASCHEYIFEKYYDYRRFEDIARACGDDWECVYQMAYLPTTPGIAHRALRRRGGALMVPQIDPKYENGDLDPTMIVAPSVSAPASVPKRAIYAPGSGRPKNAFFALYPSFVGSTSAYAAHAPELDAVLAVIAATPGHDIGDEWAWHQQMHGLQPAAITEAERAEIDARLRRYRALVDRHATLQAIVDELDAQSTSAYSPPPPPPEEPDNSSAPIGSGSSTGSGSGSQTWGGAWGELGSSGSGQAPLPSFLDPDEPHNQLAALEAEIAEVLVEEWQRGTASCLSPQNHACDWSPKEFALRYTGLYQAELEGDYKRCVEGTPGGFGTVPTNVRSDVAALEGWFEQQKQLMAQALADLPRAPGSSSVLGRRIASGHSFGDPSWFSAGYDLDIGWELAVVEKAPSGKVCRLGGRAWGKLWAGAKLLGIKSYDLIDTHTEVGVWSDNQVHFHSHLVVNDDAVYTPVDAQVPLDHTLHQSGSKPFDLVGTSNTFPVLGVPVTVAAWADMTVGYEFDAVSQTPPACNDASVPFYLGADFKPWVSVDGHGTAAVGIPGLQAGLKADLTILRAELPVHAHTAVATSAENALSLDFSTNGRLELDELSGKVSVFIDYIFDSTEKELFRWRGFHQSVPLWSLEKSVYLASLQGLPAHPAYPVLSP